MNEWNRIVEEVEKAHGKDEKFYQEMWENIFRDIFNYKKIFQDMESQRKITLGSGQKAIADIIMRNASKGEDFFLVEMKRRNHKLDTGKVEKAIEQLFSYLKLLSMQIGIIICDRVHIYYRPLGKSEKWFHIEIPFIKDLQAGNDFIKLFSKDNFDESKIISYIEEVLKTESNINKIKNEINDVFVNDLLIKYFGKNFSEEEIDKALNCIEIAVNVKDKIEDCDSIVGDKMPNSLEINPFFNVYNKVLNDCGNPFELKLHKGKIYADVFINNIRTPVQVQILKTYKKVRTYIYSYNRESYKVILNNKEFYENLIGCPLILSEGKNGVVWVKCEFGIKAFNILNCEDEIKQSIECALEMNEKLSSLYKKQK